MLKKNLQNIVCFLIILNLIYSPVTYAQNTAVVVDSAEKIAKEFSNLEKPTKKSTEFDHWKYNVMGQSAGYCWSKLKKNLPKPQKLSKYRPTKAGTFILPNTNEDLKFCESLANKGLKPVCTSSTLWVRDVKRKNDLPLDYLQVNKDKPVVVEGVIKCYLNQDQISMQTYVGPIKAEWKEKPSLKTLNTATGPKSVEFGTMMITAPNVPYIDGVSTYAEPKLAIIVEN